MIVLLTACKCCLRKRSVDLDWMNVCWWRIAPTDEFWKGNSLVEFTPTSMTWFSEHGKELIGLVQVH